MRSVPRRSSILLLAAAAAFLAVFSGPPVFGADTWMKVYGTGTEEMKTLDGLTFRAGFLVGSGLIPTADGGYLAAGYVKSDEGRLTDLALIKFDGAGTVLAYREYGTSRPRLSSKRALSAADIQSWASLAPTRDGGAVVAFDSILLKVDGQGRPVWSRDFHDEIPAGPGKDSPRRAPFAAALFKSVVALKSGDVIACGLSPSHPASPKPEPDIVLIRVRGKDGGILWSLEYPELYGSDRPALRLLPDGGLVLGCEPKAVVKLKADGSVAWAKSLEALPFERGIKERPDIGALYHYRTIGLMPGGDIIWSGVYNLSWTTYKALGALLCRISSDGDSVRWAERIHSPLHGGETFVRDIVPASSGDSFYAVGFGTEFGADEGWWNHNEVVMKMSGSGPMSWVRSIGKKKRSEAQSEYKEEQANAAVLGSDGGVVVVGSANSFAHPDPGFHRVIKWAEEHRDLLLTRLSAGGDIAALPVGRWPKMLSAPDAGDPHRVEVLAVPIGLNKLEVKPQEIALAADDGGYSLKESRLLSQFDSTTAGAESALPVADFKILPMKTAGERIARFDGTLSSSPSGRGIVGYRWTFAGTTPLATAAVAKPTYSYGLAWTQDVTLVVEDNCGYESKACTKKAVYGGIVRDRGIQTGTCSGKEVSYKVEVLTGDIKDAGTDALVEVCLYGKPDDKGQRQSSGEAFLGPTVGTTASDCFEQGQLDTFDLTHAPSEMKWDVDDVDFLSLRHMNTHKKPEWYVRGVKVTNLTTKKEWLFVPDQWLADNKPPDRKTYGEFKPEPAYPGGIFIGGEKKSAGLTEASDNIFILPKDLAEFTFTPAVPNATLTLKNASGAFRGSASTGASQVRWPFLKQAEWGIKLKAADIGGPTRFVCVLDQGGHEFVKSVWVFPSNWAGYETEARRVALLYPMEGKTGLLNCGTKYRAFMVARGLDAAKNPDMSPIIDYGLAAFGLFSDIPDEKLKWYLEHNTETYAKYKIDKVVSFLAKGTEDAGFQAMVSQYFDLLALLTKARNWAERLPQVIAFSSDDSYGGDFLADLGNSGANLKQAAAIMDKLKEKMDELMTAVRGNNPASCRTILNTIRMLCVGPHPASLTAGDHKIAGMSYGLSSDIEYPLAVVFGMALSEIQEWTAPNYTHVFFKSDYYRKMSKIVPLDGPAATRWAMNIYVPAIKDMIQVASPLIDVSLTVGETDPLWMR
jgi:hypothetical protein